MKKYTLVTVLMFMVLANSIVAQIKVNSSGYVGINNTNPSYTLDVNGNLRVISNSTSLFFDGYSLYPSSGYASLGSYGNFWQELYAYEAYFYYEPTIMSDKNLKTNISDIKAMTAKLKLLRPVTYNIKPENINSQSKSVSDIQYGFIAQELQTVFPDMVVKRDDGVLGIRYNAMIPVLVQALKEQQEQIEALTRRITQLEKTVK